MCQGLLSTCSVLGAYCVRSLWVVCGVEPPGPYLIKES